MKTHLRESQGSICPYCGLIKDSEGNEVTVLNKYTGDAFVECECGERYFVVVVPDDGT